MSVHVLRTTLGKIWADPLAPWILVAVYCCCLIAHICYGFLASFLICLFYISGSVLATVSLNNAARITKFIQVVKDYFGYTDLVQPKGRECTACGAPQCRRHLEEEQLPTLLLDGELDKAVAAFYSVILNRFILSWYSLISPDDVFARQVRQCLRDATCRLAAVIQSLDIPKLITDKLLPVLFAHHEVVATMIRQGVTMDRFSHAFILEEHPIHPAVCNRKAELQYLRTVAAQLLPKLIPRPNLQSPILCTLLRELLGTWVLLPLLDVLADPNLLNALIIAATDPPGKRIYKDSPKVPLLESFVHGSGGDGNARESADLSMAMIAVEDDELFEDQTKLYSFMQFLKREGAVDLLRFHLDVKQLNKDLQDPRVTTDPAKLSGLQQQSEKLAQHYESLVVRMPDDLRRTDELNEAHELIKQALNGRWKRAFRRTEEYFRLVYGDRSIPEGGESKTRTLRDIKKSNSGTRLSKAKVPPATEGIEAVTLEPEGSTAAAVPPTQPNNANIYSSMTQALRKERGQNLDNFMATFMQSIEQMTDVGEEAAQHQESAPQHAAPGENFVFGDLFELRSPPNGKDALNFHLHPVRGPSKCLIYIASEILCFPRLVVKMMISLVNISRQTVDMAIRSLLQRLLNVGLYEPRLAVLINMLRDQLFGDESQKAVEPTPNDLLERQRTAKRRLVGINRNLGVLADALQSPAMNKHLVYSLFDILVNEMFPGLLAPDEGDAK